MIPESELRRIQMEAENYAFRSRSMEQIYFTMKPNTTPTSLEHQQNTNVPRLRY